jgi:hypothetical protein
VQARVAKTDPSNSQSDDWRKRVILLGPSGRKILMCSGTPMSASMPGRIIYSPIDNQRQSSNLSHVTQSAQALR